VNVKMRVWVRTGCGTLGAHVYKNIIRREIMTCTMLPHTYELKIKDTRLPAVFTVLHDTAVHL
jgi:hypothetical protein